MGPVLTVLFATRNGAHTLPRALDALTRVQEPAGGWRLVVVDNASTDATPDILARYRPRLPLAIRHESTPGQNAARNTGLDTCVGDLVVFTDDDIVPEPEWLVNLRRAADANTGCDVFGGTIHPYWEAEPPSWIVDGVPLSPAFAVTPAGKTGGPARSEDCFGPNFAIRSCHFEQGLRFRTDLGPRGASYPMGGETEVLWRLDRLGARVHFVDDAVVRHIVRPWQFTSRWLRRRAFNFGRGLYHVHRRTHPPARAGTLFGIPRWRVRRFPSRFLSPLVTSELRQDRAASAAARWALWVEVGWLREERLG
ncbi:MAG: glycosyltransferase family 2 protein [Vicinamibacterales bacterium]